jgi:hypothetical protein
MIRIQNTTLQVVSILIVALPTTAGKAAESRETVPRNAYLAVGVTQSIESYESERDYIDMENAIGLSARIGGHITRHLGLEFQAEFSGPFNYTIDVMDNTLSVSKSMALMTGNLRARLPTGRWEPSLFAGYGITHSQGDWGFRGFRTGLRFGAGVNCRIFHYFCADASFGGFLIPADGEWNAMIYTVSVGVLYRLGPQRK